MILNAQNLELAFRGFKSVYTDAYNAAPIYSGKLATEVTSAARDETYGWLGQFPQLREWLSGERVVRQLAAHKYTIANRKFESTVSISRDDFSDDRYGVFAPMMAEMGHLARQHRDELIFDLIANGFTQQCYDGQHFFDTDHPVPNRADPEGGAPETYSNFTTGGGTPWFLFDTSRSIKPFIWQERERYDLQFINNPNDTRVFMTDVFYYGVRARVNAGYGLRQLAHASRAALTADAYSAARHTMMAQRGDRGRVLGVVPNVMVVPPELESAARRAIVVAMNETGSNPWAGTCELVVAPYLSA